MRAADEPATAVVPNELSVDWMHTLEKVKTVLCRPAGRPMASIRPSSARSIRSARQDRRISLFSRQSIHTTTTQLTTLDKTVAIATPSTSMPHTATRKMLSPAFRTPDTVRQMSGRFVSPTLRKIAAPKLYTMMNGIPAK